MSNALLFCGGQSAVLLVVIASLAGWLCGAGFRATKAFSGVGRTVKDAGLWGIEALFLVGIDRADGTLVRDVGPDTFIEVRPVGNGDVASATPIAREEATCTPDCPIATPFPTKELFFFTLCPSDCGPLLEPRLTLPSFQWGDAVRMA